MKGTTQTAEVDLGQSVFKRPLGYFVRSILHPQASFEALG